MATTAKGGRPTRGEARGHHERAMPGLCVRGHPLVGDNARETPGGYLVCRACTVGRRALIEQLRRVDAEAARLGEAEVQRRMADLLMRRFMAAARGQW